MQWEKGINGKSDGVTSSPILDKMISKLQVEYDKCGKSKSCDKKVFPFYFTATYSPDSKNTWNSLYEGSRRLWLQHGEKLVALFQSDLTLDTGAVTDRVNSLVTDFMSPHALSEIIVPVNKARAGRMRVKRSDEIVISLE